MFLAEIATCGYHKRCGKGIMDWTGECMTCMMHDAMEKPEYCTICLEDTKGHYHLACGHSSCRECLIKWQSQTCPVCRKPYSIVPGWYEEGGKHAGHERKLDLANSQDDSDDDND